MTVSCQEKHNNGWHPALRRPRQGMKNPNKQDGDTGPPSACREQFHHAADTHTIATAASATISLPLPHAMAIGLQAPKSVLPSWQQGARMQPAGHNPRAMMKIQKDNGVHRPKSMHTIANRAPPRRHNGEGAAANTVSRPAGRKWWSRRAPWCSGTQRQCGNHGSCPTTARRKRRPTGNKPASPRRRSRLPW